MKAPRPGAAASVPSTAGETWSRDRTDACTQRGCGNDCSMSSAKLKREPQPGPNNNCGGSTAAGSARG
eukprot:726592-Alexandrium_andersonii.AAC.1